MITWVPFPGMQTEMLKSTCFETLAGGSRGPGKTDAGVMWLIKPYLITNPRARSLVIRKNSDDLGDWLDRARYWYRRYGGEVTGSPAVVKFKSGYTIRTGHLKDDQAYTKYQGQEFQRQLIEELTQIPDEGRYLKLISSCRSTIPGLDARVMATTNPGGKGHGWVKARWKIDEMPQGNVIFKDPISERTRIFLPGSVDDNPVLMDNDPDYVRMLDALEGTDVELWKAWRNGDWNTFAGQYFKEWNPRIHTVPAFVPRSDLPKYGGMDWGRTAPFSCLFGVISKEKHEGTVFNRIIIYKEFHGTEKTPGEWADIIKYQQNMKEVDWIRGDPAMFTKGQDSSISISDQFVQNGIRIQPASNDRIGGWEVIHKWLSIAPDGLPYLLVSDNCTNLISTLPQLIHDESNIEDVDTTGPDHDADALRYMLKHLKWIDASVGGTHQEKVSSIVKHVKRPLMKLDIDAFK